MLREKNHYFPRDLKLMTTGDDDDDDTVEKLPLQRQREVHRRGGGGGGGGDISSASAWGVGIIIPTQYPGAYRVTGANREHTATNAITNTTTNSNNNRSSSEDSIMDPSQHYDSFDSLPRDYDDTPSSPTAPGTNTQMTKNLMDGEYTNLPVSYVHASHCYVAIQ